VDACNPLLQAHLTWARDEHKGRGISTCLTPVSGHLSPPFALGLAPTHLGWGTRRHFTRRPRDPPVSKHRQLARQVGACCVLTNSFLSSSRWAVSSNLPLFLSDTARAWLEHLPPGQISNWDDLVQAFAGNFQSTYVRPGNSWDLRSCRQQPGESLQDW
jgi:hypothetical protein